MDIARSRCRLGSSTLWAGMPARSAGMITHSSRLVELGLRFHAPADLRLERDRDRRARRPSSSTTRRCATDCSRRRCAADDRGEAPHPAPHRRVSASTPPTSGCPGAGPHVVRDVERLAREIVDQRLRVAANCAARTSSPTSGRSSRSRSASACRSNAARSSARARSGSMPKGGARPAAQADRRGGQLRRAAKACR